LLQKYCLSQIKKVTPLNFPSYRYFIELAFFVQIMNFSFELTLLTVDCSEKICSEYPTSQYKSFSSSKRPISFSL
jgi:hypothetical protein